MKIFRIFFSSFYINIYVTLIRDHASSKKESRGSRGLILLEMLLEKNP